MRELRLLSVVASLLFWMSSNAQVAEWAKIVGSPVGGGETYTYGAETIEEIRHDGQGNIYVLGNFMNPGLYESDTLYSIQGTAYSNTQASVLFKIDSTGALLWSRVLENTTSGGPTSRALSAEFKFDAEGNILVYAKVFDRFRFDGTNYVNSLYINKTSLVVYKVTPQNDVQWTRVIQKSGTYNTALNTAGLTPTLDGGVALCVRHRDDLLLDGQSLNVGSTFQGNHTILKLDSAGDLDWKVPFESRYDFSFSPSQDDFHGCGSMTSDISGNLYLLAALDSGLLDSTTIFPSNTSSCSSCSSPHPKLTLIKFSEDGTFHWRKLLGPTFIGAGFGSPKIVSDGTELHLIGTSWGPYLELTYDDSVLNDTAVGGYYMNLDTNGSLLKVLYTSGQNVRFKDLKLSDSLVIIGGYSKPLNYNELTYGPNASFHGENDELSYPCSGPKSFIVSMTRSGGVLKRQATVDPGGIFQSAILGTAAEMLPNGDLLAGGRFVDSYVVNGDTIFNSGNTYSESEAYLVKFKDCSYLNPFILPAQDSIEICGGESVELIGGGSGTGLSYQWYYGNSALVGETDSTLEVSAPGVYRIEVSDSICYLRSSKRTVVSGSSENVEFNMTTTAFCDGDSSIFLSEGIPAGGSYAGTGVSGSFFSPSIAGIGLHEIQYIYEQASGCIDTVSEFVTVSASSAVFFQQFSTACVGDSIVLTAGFPTGGIYSGPAVSGNLFAPLSGDTGMLTLAYSVTNGGCVASDSIDVLVAPTPNVSLDLTTDLTCENAGLVSLGGGSPSGGSFSGTAVTGSFFIPAVSGPGSFEISYTVTNGGCTDVGSDTITVDPFPLVSIPALDSVCVGADEVVLNHATPAGGYYVGIGIDSTVFDPGVPGLGTTAVSYIYENSCAADTASSTITVVGDPTLSIVPSQVTCFGADDGSVAATVLGGNAPYSFAWNSGQVSSTVTSLQPGTYILTATGEAGCSAVDSIEIAEPDSISIAIDSFSDVLCNAFSDGFIAISISGGTAPYAYSWSHGPTTEDVASLSQGNYEVTVTDSNGCTSDLNLTIDASDPVSITSSISDVTCNGASDGSITITATGGVGSHSYAWSTGDTISTLATLGQGMYFLTVMDSVGCADTDTFTVDQPDPFNATLSAEAASCFGLSDGALSVALSGGTQPYSFLWSNGASNDSLVGVPAGEYSVTATDSNGCHSVAGDTVIEPDSIALLVSQVGSILCAGDSNGTLIASIAGGLDDFNLTWSNGSTDSMLVDVIAGNYAVTIEDSTGCSNVVTSQITEPPAIDIEIDSLKALQCFGDSTGFIVVDVSGGTGTLNYAWNTGASGVGITDLDTGLYQLTVTDANGCTALFDTLFEQPQQIQISLAQTHITCLGDSNGQIDATVSNTMGPWSYSWSNGETIGSIDSLAGGYYTLTVTDSVGCSKSSTTFIQEPAALMANATIDSNVCAGDSTGTIDLQPTGGGGGYFYVWSTGDTTDLIDSLIEGSYAVTIGTSNGCMLDTSFVLQDPDPISISIDSVSGIDCFGDEDGYAVLSASGGIANYTWSWSDGGSTSFRTDLEAGAYTVTLTDSEGFNYCEIDTTIEIDGPSELIIELDTVIDNLCFAELNGEISVQVSGGLPSYSMLWSTGDTSAALDSLSAGVYGLTVTDSNQCISVSSIEVAQPDSFSIFSSSSEATCSNDQDGQISLQVNGGTAPYLYGWSNGDTLSFLSGLAPNIYILNLSDVNGCVHIDSFEIGYLHEAPVVVIEGDSGFCYGDSANISSAANGSFLWSNSATSNAIYITNSGVISLTVTDAQGCQGTDSITIEEFPTPFFSLGNDTIICADDLLEGIQLNGPDSMVSYSWSTNETSKDIVISDTGSFWLTVQNAFNCSANDTIRVIRDSCLSVPKLTKQATWKIYPNPNRGQFTVERTRPSGFEGSLHVRSANGELVESFPIRNAMVSVDLSNRGAGMYLILIVDAAGRVLEWNRVVVQ